MIELTKKEFLSRLKKKLKGLSILETRERIGFYGEIIDDKIEEGLTEEEAVAEVGSIDDIAEEIFSEVVVDKAEPERMSPWKIPLLVIGALVVWLPIYVSLVATLFAVCISLWASFVAASAVGIVAVALGCVNVFKINIIVGSATVGIGLISAGLAILLFLLCVLLTKGSIFAVKKVSLGTINCFKIRRKIT